MAVAVRHGALLLDELANALSGGLGLLEDSKDITDLTCRFIVGVIQDTTGLSLMEGAMREDKLMYFLAHKLLNDK